MRLGDKEISKMRKIDKIFYDELTWPEVKEIVSQQWVPLLPVGSVGAHGPHAPLKTDCVGPLEVCRLAANLVQGEAIVLPPVNYGFEGFHTNFPGTISITEQNLIGYVADVLFSLAHHGFKKIVIVNGHGGNPPFLNLAMRRLNLKMYPKTVACVITWWDLIPQEDLNRLSESEFGGMRHAGELETSIMLHTDPDVVQMDKAVKELWDGDLRCSGETTAGMSRAGGTPVGPAMYVGWMGGRGGHDSGIMGDPTVATAEKGRKWLTIAAENLAQFILDWKEMPIHPPVDHH